MKKIMIVATATAILSTGAFAENHDVVNSIYSENIQWEESGVPGAQFGQLWGSTEAEDAAWLVRIAPGAAFPVHGHSNDYWGLSLQGNWIHTGPDGNEVSLTAGSYIFQPAVEWHADRCDGTEDCIIFLDFDGVRNAVFPE